MSKNIASLFWRECRMGKNIASLFWRECRMSKNIASLFWRECRMSKNGGNWSIYCFDEIERVQRVIL